MKDAFATLTWTDDDAVEDVQDWYTEPCLDLTLGPLTRRDVLALHTFLETHPDLNRFAQGVLDCLFPADATITFLPEPEGATT